MVISIMEFEGGRFRCPDQFQHQYDFHLPPCWFNGQSNFRAPLPQPSCPLTVKVPMERIVGRLRSLGQTPVAAAPSQAVARGVKRGHNSARVVRNWRVVLGKICTILTMVILQDAIGDWCPESSVPASLPSSQPTVEEIYAELSADAKPLPPLKSQEPPSVSASSCVHPTGQLKGGGNASLEVGESFPCHGGPR